MRAPRRCRTSGSSRRWTSVFLTSTSLLALHLLQGAAASGTLEGLERGGDLDRRRGSGGLGLPSFEAGPDAERGAYLGRRRPMIRGRGGGPGGGNGRHLVVDGELSSPHLEMADVEYQYVNGGEEEEEEEEHPIPEPPSIVNIDPGSIDRCSGLRASDYEAGKVCGSPLTAPCFNRSRCDRLSIYVYDQEVRGRARRRRCRRPSSSPVLFLLFLHGSVVHFGPGIFCRGVFYLYLPCPALLVTLMRHSLSMLPSLSSCCSAVIENTFGSNSPQAPRTQPPVACCRNCSSALVPKIECAGCPCSLCTLYAKLHAGSTCPSHVLGTMIARF